MPAFHSNSNSTSVGAHVDRRYRVAVADKELALQWNWQVGEDQHSGSAEIQGLSIDGVQLRLPAGSNEIAPPGSQATLRFSDRVNGQIYVVPGVVEAVETVDARTLVEIVFIDDHDLAQALGESPAWRHFNRRHSFRVDPQYGSIRRTQVELEWRGHSARHLLHDISADGLSIRLAKNDDLVIPSERPIRARLKVPSPSSVLEFVISKRHEMHLPTHRRVGMQIDWLRTPRSGVVEQELVAAVLHWQRQALRTRSERKTQDENSPR